MTPEPQASLAQVSRAIRERRCSAVEYTQACLDRASRLQPQLGAFATLRGDAVLASAALADAAIARGEWRGPLHGIALGIKDVIDVAGLPTLAQSRQLRGYVPERNAWAVDRLLAAGAIVLGKLTTHEFAFGPPVVGECGPVARNPWNPRHFAGGSSSGAAVAVAAGMLPGALGSDTAGSLRSPAALCGVVGFKPSRARIPRHGAWPLADSLDALGPIARNVEDCALIYQALALPPGPPPPLALRWPKPPRIGVARSFFNQGSPLQAQGREAIEAALAVFAGLGCSVSDVPLAPLRDWNAAGMVILLSEAYAFHQHWLRTRPQDYGQALHDALLLGATLSAADYVRALEQRQRLTAQLDAAMHTVDVLIAPIQAGQAPRLEQLNEWGFLETPSFGIAFNLGDYPALSLCCGFGDLGLPLGMQLVGRRTGEQSLLQAGYAYEQACAWHLRHPSL
ncbi:amidase [Pseudomonas typographi]|uniref:Amidase n=1 Tax=Pseudomonas typographi TaxID=2715964 RepID=A0ABR7Z8K3_9PSED|nr:amidase [Pseudomonas typographi]MBD1552040.1 amidase [Pseudomonas typographi]MBD1586603.1 amidase [Pseudomonas typographi]MBD1601755.1 amidase [Pseudomonas typographi]